MNSPWNRFALPRRAAAAFAVLAFAGAAPVVGPADPNNITGTTGLILIDKLGHHIRFFDPTTHKELSNLNVDANPHDVAISPDRRTAYVPVYGDGVYGRNPHPGHTILSIDLATHQITDTMDVAPYQAPHDIKIDPAGTLYVVCDISRKLLVINPQARKIEAAIDTEGTGHWFAVLPDGSKAYVANKNDKPFISVIDLRARKMIGRVPAPNGTEGIAASPDGKRVLALDYRDPLLLVIDTKTDAVVDRVPIEEGARGAYIVRYTPDGSKVLVCTLNGKINVLDASDLHGKQQVFQAGKNPMGFAFAPDGRTVLVANHGDGTVSVLDLKEQRITGTFMAGTGIESGSYY
jgi:YVTN family beta-propeller protein